MNKFKNNKVIKNIIKFSTKKYFFILMFALEFIFATIMCKELFGMVLQKNYYNHINIKKCFLFIFSALICFLIIIFNVKNYKEKVEKMYITFIIPIAICYSLFMLPLNVPDEGSHIIRAYDISLGHFFTPIDKDGIGKTTYPEELKTYSHIMLQSYSDFYSKSSKKTDYTKTVSSVATTCSYSPIVYLGSAIVFKISKILNINIYKAIILARLFNICIFLIFAYLAIKKIPFGKVVFALTLSLPMMIQQFSSVSADCILNGIMIYYIALSLNMVLNGSENKKSDKIILCILTAILGMIKYVYILLAGILFLIPFKKGISKKERINNIKFLVLILLVGSVFTIVSYSFSLRYKGINESTKKYFEANNVDAKQQVEYIKSNKVKFLDILRNELINNRYEYLSTEIGSKLGWLDIYINPGIIVMFLVILIIATLSEKSDYELNISSKIWILAIPLMIEILVFITMYITFTPIGFDRIAGVQGRYFTPMLILIFVCFIKKDNYWKVKNLSLKMFLIADILNIFALSQIIDKFL